MKGFIKTDIYDSVSEYLGQPAKEVIQWLSIVLSSTACLITDMAYSNVGLGIAHSMAHTLGAVYDTPHGVACAMMLPIVMEFNKEYTGEKYKAIAEAFDIDTTGMDQAQYRQAAIDAVQQLSVDVGIPTKLEKLKEEDLPYLCESAAADACAPGNPREATLADYEAMFRKLM